MKDISLKVYAGQQNSYNDYRRRLYGCIDNSISLDQQAHDFFGLNNTGNHFHNAHVFYVYGLKDDKILWAKNFYNLGYDDIGFHKSQLRAMTHPDHQDIITYLFHTFFMFLGKNPIYMDAYIKRLFFIQLRRCMKEKNGDYWEVVQRIYSFDVDHKGDLCKYGVSMSIVGKAPKNGHSPISVQIVPTGGNEREVKSISEEYEASKKKAVFDLLGFTRGERRILERLMDKEDKENIYNSLGLQKRGFESISRRILAKGRVFFNEDWFKSTSEIAYFLKNI